MVHKTCTLVSTTKISKISGTCSSAHSGHMGSHKSMTQRMMWTSLESDPCLLEASGEGPCPCFSASPSASGNSPGRASQDSASISFACGQNRFAYPAAPLFVFRAEARRQHRRQILRVPVQTPPTKLLKLVTSASVSLAFTDLQILLRGCLLSVPKYSEATASSNPTNASGNPPAKLLKLIAPNTDLQKLLRGCLLSVPKYSEAPSSSNPTIASGNSPNAGCLCPRDSNAIRRGRFAIPTMVRKHRKTKLADL